MMATIAMISVIGYPGTTNAGVKSLRLVRRKYMLINDMHQETVVTKTIIGKCYGLSSLAGVGSGKLSEFVYAITGSQ
jgi:hypothetical protein